MNSWVLKSFPPRKPVTRTVKISLTISLSSTLLNVMEVRCRSASEYVLSVLSHTTRVNHLTSRMSTIHDSAYEESHYVIKRSASCKRGRVINCEGREEGAFWHIGLRCHSRKAKVSAMCVYMGKISNVLLFILNVCTLRNIKACD